MFLNKLFLKKILRLPFLLFFIVFSLSSQQITRFPINDSLESLMDKSLILLFDENKIKDAMEYAIKVAEYADKQNNDYYKAKGHYIIAACYETITDSEKAKEHYEKSLEYAMISQDSLLITYIYNGLGNMFTAQENKDLESSVLYYKKSLKLGLGLKKYNPLSASINLAWSYMDMKQYEKANLYLIKSEELLKTQKNVWGDCEVKYLKGRYYLSKKNVEIAKQYFEDALNLANKHSMLKMLDLIYYERAKSYEEYNEYEKAYRDILKVQKVRKKINADQIEVTKVNFIIDEYKNELEITKKEKDYQTILANNNRIINIISTIGLVFVLGVLLFLYKEYRSKKRLNIALRERNEELNRAKSHAEKLTQIKSQFIATVSHELRTPLYGVVGITSLLLEDENILKKHEKLLGALKFSGDYLLDLISNVLKISKIESNNVVLKNTHTDLRKLSKNLFSSFHYQTKSKNNKLLLEIDDTVPRIVSVDSLRLSEILINLVSNASKYTENGNIWLKIRMISEKKDKVYLRFEVVDNGIGIPDNKKEFVFEQFTQIDRVLDKLDGTGLGLSIVKKLVHIMDSEIYLESVEGKGARFYFDLELDVINEVQNLIDATIKQETLRNEKVILIVEDNKINQLVTKNLLEIIGYQCVIVENGLKAVKAVKNSKYDLILMDLNMPFLNGFEASKQIREFNKTIPIVALTASEIIEVNAGCVEAGMNDIINKPLNKNDLSAIIKKNLVVKDIS